MIELQTIINTGKKRKQSTIVQSDVHDDREELFLDIIR